MYLSNFRRTLELIPLINWEITLQLTWSTNCVISQIQNSMLRCNSVNSKQRKTSRTIWDHYENYIQNLKPINKNLNYLNDPRFQGVNRLFVLSFENEADRTGRTRHYIQKVQINDNKVKTEWNFFEQSVKNYTGTFENIWKTATDQWDGYTTCCLLSPS